MAEISEEERCKGCEEEPKWKAFIRPGGFIITLFLFFLLVFIDGNVGEFAIKEAYFPIIEAVLVTIVIALYASRGAEKVTNYMTNGRYQQPSNNYRYERSDYPEAFQEERYERPNYRDRYQTSNQNINYIYEEEDQDKNEYYNYSDGRIRRD